ncbi:MAG: hypothetical protein R6U63_07175 [Longimicrobiales bacterium]
MMALAAAVAPAVAQNGSPDRVRVFLDCQTHGCDRQEFRTEITFVDWVRERTVADVHVIVTSQSAGGGRQYVFDFIGLGDFAGTDLRLEETTSDTDTRDEVLGALVRTFKGGLVPYVARRGYLDELSITALEPATEPTTDELALAADDPWHLWVFSVSTDFEADGEEQQSSYEIGGRLSANRTTPDWKINIGLDGDHQYERFELDDSTTYTNETDDWEFDVLAVRSLSPHWSAGTVLEVNTSTNLNRKVGGRAAAALEWNFFPYEEANRRQFIFHYQVGFSRVEYEDTTVFDKIEETLYDHKLVAVYDTRQPWGNVSFSAEASNLLHDFSKYRLATRARVNFRLFRGFDLRIQGNYQLIRDQVYLPRAGSTPEEILRQRRQLATGYQYGFEIGFNYRFGSIYNNVVNNRFPWSVLR